MILVHAKAQGRKAEKARRRIAGKHAAFAPSRLCVNPFFLISAPPESVP